MKNIVSKFTTLTLLFSMSIMTLSCAITLDEQKYLTNGKIKPELSNSDEPLRIRRPVKAILNEGGYIFYKKMEVANDTIITRGLKFNDTQTDSIYVDKTPLSEIEQIEFIDETGKLYYKLGEGLLMVGVIIGIYQILGIFFDGIILPI